MSRRILVVDDERLIADTLCAILRDSGYDAFAVYDAETALAACGDHRPAFVISDVSMPGMNGVEMAVQLQHCCPGCGVLLCSGYPKGLEILESARAKGYDFELLAKPVHPKEILAKLEVAAGRSVESERYLRGGDVMAG